MKIFRVTMEVSDLEAATRLYQQLLADDGQRHHGARHYFNLGGVVLAVLDVSQGGLTPRPLAKCLYIAADKLEPIHARAKTLGVLAEYQVHGAAGGEIGKRPWGERSFYVTDPWGNELCFVEDGTLYT